MATETWEPFNRDPKLPPPENLARRSLAAQCLIRCRVAAGLKQTELAERAGIMPQTLSMHETRAPISVESWRAYQSVLPDLPAEWAFEYPRLVHQHTGQPAAIPSGADLAAEKAKIAALTVVVAPAQRDDGYPESDPPPPPPAVTYYPDGTKVFRDGHIEHPDGSVVYPEGAE